MRRMAPRDALAVLLAVGFAVAMIVAMNRWSEAAEAAEPGAFLPLMPADEAAAADTPELRRLKESLFGDVVSFELHNEVYTAVGPERWDAEVQPAMVRALLGRMTDDTGIVIPTDEQVIRWAEENPESVRETVRAFLP